MEKQPFIINLTEKDLPNLAQDSADSFGFEYSNNSVWQEESADISKLLMQIDKKLDTIIQIIEQSGKG